MAVLMAAAAAVAIALASAGATTSFTVAEAQYGTNEKGVQIVDQSNMEQTIVQEQNQEACTSSVAPFVPGRNVLSGVQSNDCEVDQTQTASAVSRARHEIAMNSIRNLPG